LESSSALILTSDDFCVWFVDGLLKRHLTIELLSKKLKATVEAYLEGKFEAGFYEYQQIYYATTRKLKVNCCRFDWLRDNDALL
jgi:hypothetical protein